ncbi:mCG1042684, partial [Mus musculus]
YTSSSRATPPNIATPWAPPCLLSGGVEGMHHHLPVIFKTKNTEEISFKGASLEQCLSFLVCVAEKPLGAAAWWLHGGP